jgi:hypothetical protein
MLPKTEWARLKRVRTKGTVLVIDCRAAVASYCGLFVKESIETVLQKNTAFNLLGSHQAPPGSSLPKSRDWIKLGDKYNALYVVWITLRPQFDERKSKQQQDLYVAYTELAARIAETSDGKVLLTESIDPGNDGNGVRGLAYKRVNGVTNEPKDAVMNSIKKALALLAEELAYWEAPAR